MDRMTLAEVRAWLETQVDSPRWYIGTIDRSQSHCIGLFGLIEEPPPPVFAVGGLSHTGYTVKPVSIIIHWGDDADIAEQKAQEVYGALFGRSATIGGKRVVMFQMQTSEPIAVETDSQGKFEYKIEMIIYYER